jgi:hypothetical protein
MFRKVLNNMLKLCTIAVAHTLCKGFEFLTLLVDISI